MTTQSQKDVKIDVHIHLAGTGCHCSGCWINPSFKKRMTFKALKFLHKITQQQMDSNLDQIWVERISKLISESELDYGVVLGFDGVIDSDSRQIDNQKSQMIIPPAWVFDACKKYPNLLPGPSINPHAEDALKTLDYCIEESAVLIKWLPSAQLITPSDRTLRAFYEKLEETGIPLLIHCGGERTFASLDPKLNDVWHLEFALELGVKVICAHSATKVIGSNEENQLPHLKKLLAEYDNLWVDNSGICNPSRFSHLPNLANDPIIDKRTLYGSDWPVPSNAIFYLNQLGPKKVWELEREKNWIARDIKIKREFGVSENSLTRAYQQKVLGNLDKWIKA